MDDIWVSTLESILERPLTPDEKEDMMLQSSGE